jgi:hypothetical protein
MESPCTQSVHVSCAIRTAKTYYHPLRIIDLAVIVIFPRPHSLCERFPAKIVSCLPLLLPERFLNNRLGGDAGMITPRNSCRCVALHAMPTYEEVL